MRDNEKDAISEPNYAMKEHTACQTCGWTKNALKGGGKCYKYVFYGIESHRCVQMTPVIKCNERCVFCWRDHQGHSWELDADWQDPEEVVEASIKLQRELLSGFKGNEEVTLERFEEAMDPKHVAISLDGEPTIYPYLPELLEEFHNRGLTTFLVSNGTNPEVLRKCNPTQLYISVDAPDRETFKQVVRPVEDNLWESLMDTLDIISEKDCRTVIRTTLVKGHNMTSIPKYKEIFRKASPNFIELKAYMHVGHSQDRMKRKAMPEHDDVVQFTNKLQDEISSYSTIKQVPRSRVALLSKKEDTWIEELKKESKPKETAKVK